MLFRYELKKVLFTHKGLLILLVCLVLKSVFCVLMPELKDTRIALSHVQYDRFLARFSGADSTEKQVMINEEYRNCVELIDSRDDMTRKYSRGEITEEEWNEYAERLSRAEIQINALTIFKEKADQFIEQEVWMLPKAHYMYEYGWQTVFSTHLLPDLFLLAGLLFLAARCFSFEAEDGMLPILLTASRGRGQLCAAKLEVLALTAAITCGIGTLTEMLVFKNRGFLEGCSAPIYSITLFAEETAFDFSLGAGYALSMLIQGLTTVVLVLVIFALSLKIRSTVRLIFISAAILILGYLSRAVSMAFFAFTPTGLLSGSAFLKVLGRLFLHQNLTF